MKDLIKEIEGLKDFSLEDSALDIVIREITNENVDKVLSILNQHNLITAPKQIKLSEIVERLNEEQTDYEFRYKEGSISVWKNHWCYAILGIKYDTRKLYFDMHDSYLFPKWLYTLWIVDSEIIDDLEDKE